MKHKDGSWVWILDRGRVMTRDDTGKALSMFGTHTDITDLKQTEEALNREHMMLARTEAVAHVGSWEWQTEGDKVTWSEELFRIFGLEPMEEAPPFAEHQAFYVPEDRARLVKAVEECLKNGVPYDLEVGVMRPDGQLRHCVVRGFPERSPDGSVKRLYGSLHDITEMRRAEERIYLLGHMLDEAPAGISIHDTDGRFVFANAKNVALHGYDSLEEFLGVNLHELDVPESEALIAERFRKIAEDGEARFEAAHYRKDGSSFPLEVLAKQIEWEGRPAILSIAADITERKQAESALRESEGRYRRYIESSPNGVFVCDDHGHYLEVNPAASFVTGYSQDELTAMCIADLLFEDDRDAGIRHFETLVREGTSYGELPYRHKNGERRWWSVSAVKLSDTRFLGFCTDVTNRKRAEQALRYSENLFRRVFELLPIGLWIADKHGTLQQGNPAGVRIWGAEPHVPQEEYGVFKARRLPSGEEIAPDDWALAHTVKEGITVIDEILEIDAFDGEKRVIVNYTSPVTDEAGNTLAAIVMNHDITEQYRAEQALRESEKRLRAVFNSVDGVPIQGYDKDRRVIFWNPASELLYGYSHGEAIGRALEELIIPEESRQAVVEGIRQWHDQGVPIPAGEIELLNKNGERLKVYSNHVMITNHIGEKEMFCIDVDLTEQKEHEKTILKLNERYKKAQEMGVVGNWEFDIQTGTFWGSEQAKRIYGLNPDDDFFTSEDVFSCIPEKDRITQALNDLIEKEKPFNLEHDIVTFDRKIKKTLSSHAELVKDGNNKPLKIVGVIQDITKRVEYEQELLRQQRFLDLYNQIAGIFLTSPRDEVFANVLDTILMRLDSQFGYFGYIDETGDLVCPSMTRDVWDQCQVAEKNIVFPRAGWAGLWGRSLMEKCTLVANEKLQVPEGHVVLENALATPILHRDTLIGQFVIANKAGGYHKEDQDILEAAAAYTAPILFAIQEEVRQKSTHEKLEAQLRQAQKMEAVGRLAGGVAHDFNNMLGIIIGHADMVLEEMDQGQPFYKDLSEIRKAGVRSADLTRQLLAFARKQTVAPKVIDLNITVESMLKMLHRLIGENIDLAWIPGKEVWPIKIDPGQIDQILANLCVNARDAIAEVGKVTVETGNTVFDEDYCKYQAGFIPGEYTMLAVSDNGCGMDSETLSQVFEPFFTTKEPGKGTGLGLAMVYGVVKQNNGFINVYSEPGQGTTFKIYLPRHSAKAVRYPEKRQDKPKERGQEIILLVEDDQAILGLTTRMLEREGYTVMAAGTPGEAIRLANEHAGDIHLLMSDVVMPEMNGRDLAKNILSLYPQLKCLFMSGYTANVIAHQGVLDEGVNFLQKPFSKGDLAVKVREVLDRE
jgi:PAS domain S-box-containing protein